MLDQWQMEYLLGEDVGYRLYQGDCLDVLASLDAGSVDLCLTDPPYGTMKGAALDGWANVETDWDVALAPDEVFEHCNTALRMNGALILFSQEPYTSRLISESHGNLPFSYRMVWLKDHFANALLAKKAPVSYFEDILVFFKKYDTLGLHPLREYSLRVLEHCGIGLKGINAKLGHRRAEHFFYVDSTQFGLCTSQTYSEICKVFGIDKQPWFKSFDELKMIDRRFNRRFNIPPTQKFKSNVLAYKKDYDGYHPTQKPVALLEDIIKTYTDPGDVVLDFTMGSGSTGVAAANTGRRFIGIELDENYFQIAKERIEKSYSENQQNAA